MKSYNSRLKYQVSPVILYQSRQGIVQISETDQNPWTNYLSLSLKCYNDMRLSLRLLSYWLSIPPLYILTLGDINRTEIGSQHLHLIMNNNSSNFNFRR